MDVQIQDVLNRVSLRDKDNQANEFKPGGSDKPGCPELAQFEERTDG